MKSASKIRTRSKVTGIGGQVVVGLTALSIFLGGFGAWAVTAPLSGAVIAPGRIMKEGESRVLSHESGGVVMAIHVREGDRVAQGEVLVEIDNVARRAELDQLQNRLAGLNARADRLQAEREGATEFPQKAGLRLSGRSEDIAVFVSEPGRFDHLIRDQRAEFLARRAQRLSETDLLETQRRVLHEEMAGLEGETSAIEAQIESLENEIALRRQLAREGYARKTELRQFERDLARMKGEQARLETRRQALPHRLSEVDAKLRQLERDFQEEIARDLAEARQEMAEVKSQLSAAENNVARVAVAAPAPGVIDKMHVNTLGSAVQPYTPIVEIVPENEAVIMEVEVSPADIDGIHVGQPARVVLSSFDMEEVQPVSAKVSFVSPDRRVGENDGRAFFVARLRLDAEQSSSVPELQSGMPVEAYMTTQERTFLQIMMDPFAQSLRRAFRG